MGGLPPIPFNRKKPAFLTTTHDIDPFNATGLFRWGGGGGGGQSMKFLQLCLKETPVIQFQNTFSFSLFQDLKQMAFLKMNSST